METLIKIEKISSKHAAQWQKLWQKYLQFYNTTLDKDVYENTFKRLTSKADKSCEGLIAISNNNEAAGIAHFITHRHLWQTEDICYLQDLFVEEAHRRKKIATHLILAVYKQADIKKLKGVYWLTKNDNTKARRLYDQIGRLTPFVKYARQI